MKHQKDSQKTRSMVYQYGTVPARIAPVLNEDQALVQMRLARRLWNVLVTVERYHTAGYRRVMSDEAQVEIEKLRERKEALWKEKKTRSQKARTKVATPDLDDELARVRSALGMLLEHQKATQKARHAARQEQLDALNALRNRRVKRARRAAGPKGLGLFWGTYNAVIQSADTGRKLGELKYRSFRGEGTLTAQIIDGASVEACVEGPHTFFQIDSATPGQKWRYARVRIGSGEKSRTPLWVSLPIVYHRDIPPLARIKSVSATRRLLAGKVQWALNVSVALPPVPVKNPGAAVAIDIGWRLLPAGGRVAYWQDDAGSHSEVLVPASDIAQFKKVNDLRSITDCARDQFQPELVKWLGGQSLDSEWQRRTLTLAQWRSGDRLASLIRWWGDHRLDEDAQIFASATSWRRQYLHLTNWWRNQQDQMTLRVREQYRIFAAQLAARYATVILEKFDLRQVAEPKEDEKNKTIGSYRQMLSPSVFRGAVVNACKREGVEVRIVPAAYSTSTCHACGHAEVWDQAASVLHRCGQCGELWDQDHNAAINLLASGKAAPTKNQSDSPEILPGSGDRSPSEGEEGMGSTV
jgi:hypothetical protein